nr:tetratricopeptide repeat protein [Casimicrobiaceae bacterium]
MPLTLQEAFALAARHEAAGRSADARRIYEEILEALPEHPGALLKIANQEFAAGENDRARERLLCALAAARQQSLPTQDIWLALAAAHSAAGDGDAARAAIEEAHAIGKRLKASGATAVALAVLERCVELAPEDATLRVTLGALLLDANRAADAERELERAVSSGADGGETWDNLGLAHRVRGNDEQALIAFQRAAAAAPALTPALANLVYARYTLCEW